MPGAEDWLADFYELSSDRQRGDGWIGQLPAASIDRHTAGWPDEDRQMFRACMRALDEVFLKSQRNEPDLPESDNPARDMFRAKMGAAKP